RISSKLAFDYPGCEGGLTADEIERECEKSLKRLQTDYIDIYYSHRDDFDTPLEETMEAFHRLVKKGKVRTIGASNLYIWRIAEANMLSELKGWTPYQAVEQRYTYLRPRHGADFGPQIFITEDMKKFCKHHNVSLIGYSVLLQGAYTREDREIPAQFAGPYSDERLQALRKVSRDVGATPNQVVIAWMLHSDPVILPLFGGSKPEHLEENLGALDVKLSDEQMRILD
ncbi:MAG: aldo/keto reductase, partial [Rhodothermales bacterium]